MKHDPTHRLYHAGFKISIIIGLYMVMVLWSKWVQFKFNPIRSEPYN